jgi:hypothetical protein
MILIYDGNILRILLGSMSSNPLLETIYIAEMPVIFILNIVCV